MRIVTVSTAFALSIAALSLSAPAFAVPAKKQPVAKQQSAAKVVPVKKPAVAKKQRAASVAPVKKAAIAKQRRVAAVAPVTVVTYDRHGVAGSADVGLSPQQNARRAGSAQGSRMPRFFASADPVSEARRWIGTNPTDRDRLWCARFMNFVLERSGFTGTGSDAAKSFASYGHRVSGPQVGAIAVMSRGKNGGHVGIVSGIDASGNPIIISGNSNGRRVHEGAYPRGRIYAYVLPR